MTLLVLTPEYTAVLMMA